MHDYNGTQWKCLQPKWEQLQNRTMSLLCHRVHINNRNGLTEQIKRCGAWMRRALWSNRWCNGCARCSGSIGQNGRIGQCWASRQCGCTPMQDPVWPPSHRFLGPDVNSFLRHCYKHHRRLTSALAICPATQLRLALRHRRCRPQAGEGPIERVVAENEVLPSGRSFGPGRSVFAASTLAPIPT